MEEPNGGARTVRVPWRAILEIAFFAVAATVLVTGVDLSTVGRALARLPGPSLVQTRPARVPAPQPKAARPRAAVKKPPSARATLPAASPAAAARAKASIKKPASSGPVPAASRPGTLVDESAPSPGAPTEVDRIQHFYALVDKGIVLYNNGWYGPALARFRQAAAVLPNSPYAHLWWGRAALAAGRLEEARFPLERAIALAPGTEVARKAHLLLQQLNSGD